MATNKYLINQEFVVLNPDKEATTEQCDATLYQRLNQRYGDFKGHELISCHEFSEDWSTWEIHPHGDEIVLLISGEVTFVLQLESGEELINLNREGEYLVVPKNIWHTARIKQKAKLLFITPGQETSHRNL